MKNPDRPCVVETAVVTREANLASAVRLRQCDSEDQEIGPTLAFFGMSARSRRSRNRHPCTQPSSPSGLSSGPPAGSTAALTSATERDADESSLRPGRQAIPRRPSLGLFLPTQLLCGRRVNSFVALPLHGVLRTMNRIAFLIQDTAHLVTAEADPGRFRQLCSESSGQLGREAIAEDQ